jgi:hypothetical protein
MIWGMERPWYSEIVPAISLALLLGTSGGCTQRAESQADISPPVEADVLPPIDEAGAIAIAKKAIFDRRGGLEKARFKAERDTSGWQILVWWEPFAPGDHVIVSIDKSGMVTAFSTGSIKRFPVKSKKTRQAENTIETRDAVPPVSGCSGITATHARPTRPIEKRFRFPKSDDFPVDFRRAPV